MTFGVQNITDEEPPWVPVNTGFDATLHDPRGRVWFARFSGSL
jgi:outer membrane receptor protein involved in Fe transport